LNQPYSTAKLNAKMRKILLMSSFDALVGSAECWGILTIRHFNSFGFFWDTLLNRISSDYFRYPGIWSCSFKCETREAKPSILLCLWPSPPWFSTKTKCRRSGKDSLTINLVGKRCYHVERRWLELDSVAQLVRALHQRVYSCIFCSCFWLDLNDQNPLQTDSTSFTLTNGYTSGAGCSRWVSASFFGFPCV
jgi:hypothetical protein